MPASFVAQATNAQGQTVTMLITPDSITTLTMANAPGQTATSGSTDHAQSSSGSTSKQ